MNVLLEQALLPVLRDVLVSGVPEPTVVDEHWSDWPRETTAFFTSAGGGSDGLHMGLDGSPAERIVEVADQVQEWVIHELWPEAATNWPACPHHPETHPVKALVVGSAALWCCPTDSTAFWTVGELDQAPHQSSG
jgi:hypothetical protein